MATLHDRLTALTKQVRSRSKVKPRVAILLGTGLGGLAERLKADVRISYHELEGMPVSTAESHKGEVVLGTLAGVPVVAFSGRLHAYEGHGPAAVVVPVQLAKYLGAKTLVMGSAVGGLNPQFQVGDLVVLEDHLNLMGINPLVGPNDDRVGPRWPDMLDTYSAELRSLAHAEALAMGIKLQSAVYAGVLGPNLETRAEYRMLRGHGRRCGRHEHRTRSDRRGTLRHPLPDLRHRHRPLPAGCARSSQHRQNHRRRQGRRTDLDQAADEAAAQTVNAPPTEMRGDSRSS